MATVSKEILAIYKDKLTNALHDIFQHTDFKEGIDRKIIIKERVRFITFMRKLDSLSGVPNLSFAMMKQYYSTHIVEFIVHWGFTDDPRFIFNTDRVLPFILYQRQRELVRKVVECIDHKKPLFIDKVRSVGATWVIIAVFCTLAIFRKYQSFALVTMNEDSLEVVGDVSTLFPKIKFFIEHLPIEFRGDYSVMKDIKKRYIFIPATGSSFTGEFGKEAGRSKRHTVVFLDEAAFNNNYPKLIAALTESCSCLIQCSTLPHNDNAYTDNLDYAVANNIDVFKITAFDDPRMTEERLETKRLEYGALQSLFQIEILGIRNQELTNEIINIQAINSAFTDIIKQSTEIVGAFDVADKGTDLCALAIRMGSTLIHIEEWSGTLIDINDSFDKVLNILKVFNCKKLIFDGTGMGYAITTLIKDRSRMGINFDVEFTNFIANEAAQAELDNIHSAKVSKNFENIKAQYWFKLANMFINTYRGSFDEPHILISKNISLELRAKLSLQLRQIVWYDTPSGKLCIEKRGARDVKTTVSPDLADSLMMCFSVPCSSGGLIYKKLFHYDF